MALPENPKQAYGDKKPNVALVPPALDLYAALALGDGAVKYKPFNWRDSKVQAMTYVAAIMRHLGAWVDRQELSEAEGFIDADGTSYKLGGKPQLAHVAACVAILADAEAGGFLIDNRPPAGPSLKIQGDWHGKLPVGERKTAFEVREEAMEHRPTDSHLVIEKNETQRLWENYTIGPEETAQKILQQKGWRWTSEADRRIGKVDDRWVPQAARLEPRPLPEPVGKYEHACPDIDQEYPPCLCKPNTNCPGCTYVEDLRTGQRLQCVVLRAKDDQRFDVV